MTDGTAAIGTIHFALMALLAALVVIGIVWGVRNKRRRVQGQKEFEAHAEEAGVELNQPEPEAAPPAPAPVASPPVAPPPLADQPVVGTPPLTDEPPRTRPLADEPIVAAVTPDGATVALAAEAAAGDVSEPGDAPLTQIKGLGPKVAARMAALGVDRVGQLAALDDRGVHDLDAQMGAFTGRIMRDRWVEQARLLTAGDREGFERAFGKLG